jgi:hypothetical protein
MLGVKSQSKLNILPARHVAVVILWRAEVLLVMRFHPIFYGTVALLVLPAQSLNEESIYRLIVFGDSLSDNGNAAAALASVGKTLGNYAANSLTDGPRTMPATSGPDGLWIDQFRQRRR